MSARSSERLCAATTRRPTRRPKVAAVMRKQRRRRCIYTHSEEDVVEGRMGGPSFLQTTHAARLATSMLWLAAWAEIGNARNFEMRAAHVRRLTVWRYMYIRDN